MECLYSKTGNKGSTFPLTTHPIETESCSHGNKARNVIQIGEEEVKLFLKYGPGQNQLKLCKGSCMGCL